MNARPTVLLIGATGMLGSAVQKVFAGLGWHVRAPDRQELDICKSEVNLTDFVSGSDAVINAAGLTNRYLHLGEAAVMAANADFPHRLAQSAEHAGVPMIQISTDCVFAGSGGAVDEAQPADASDLYGRSKAAGEPGSAMVLRCSFIGPEKRAFRNLLCWALSQPFDGLVPGYTNHLWNGVTTPVLARLMADLFEKDMVNPGLHHIHGTDVSKFELLQMMYRAFGRDPDQVAPTQAAQAVDRRLSTCRPLGLAGCVLPMHSQLTALVTQCDPLGRW